MIYLWFLILCFFKSVQGGINDNGIDSYEISSVQSLTSEKIEGAARSRLRQTASPRSHNGRSVPSSSPTAANMTTFVLSVPSGKHSKEQDTVKVELYYESRCPSSIHLYINELSSLVIKIGDDIQLLTYPYGDAQMSEKDGKTTFTCQHGPEECYGNELHACAIDNLEDTNVYVDFNTCLMLYNSTDHGADLCGESLQINPSPIKDCAKGDRGIQLLKYYSAETAKVDPSYVPYVVINGKVMDLDNKVLPSVCAAFKNPPKECQK